VDSAEGMATLEAMSSHHNFRPGQQNKLVSEPPIAAPDEHAQLVEADQRFRAALGQAIAAGGERIEAVEATVQLSGARNCPGRPAAVPTDHMPLYWLCYHLNKVCYNLIAVYSDQCGTFSRRRMRSRYMQMAGRI
jgi:hypothetical protein